MMPPEFYLYSDPGVTCPSEYESGYLRAMIRWRGDEKMGGPLSRLKGRQFLAQLEGESLAVVLVRYELDKSSALSAIIGKHVMVVDATALSPSLRPDRIERSIVDAGLQRTLMQLAQYHGQRIEFRGETFSYENPLDSDECASPFSTASEDSA